MKELPVQLKYMVYYIRSCLKVELKDQNTRISYAAFAHRTVKEKMAFLLEMKVIEGQQLIVSKEKEDSVNVKSLLGKAKEHVAIMMSTGDRMLKEDEEIIRHNCMYRVRVLYKEDGFKPGVPYRIICYKADDVTDMDYINLTEIKDKSSLPFRPNATNTTKKATQLEGNALRTYLRDHIKIYREPFTERIEHIGLTGGVTLSDEDARGQVDLLRRTTKKKQIAEIGKIKPLAECEINRKGHSYICQLVSKL